MSRVLITGATGFVGAGALRPLVEAGHEVHAVGRHRGPELPGVTWHEADLLCGSQVVDDVRPELLMHLAWYAEHGKFWSSPENVRWVEASLALLRAFVEAGGRRAVTVGTCAEYEWSGEGDLNERRSPLRPATLYGVSKDALRRVGAAFASESSFELAWARLFFLYGPGEASTRLVPSVILPLLEGKRAETTIGSQVRDFMHVEDAARALVALAESDVTGPINIASGDGVPVAEVVDVIGALTERPDLLDRGARPMPAGEPPRIVADVGRLEREVGFKPGISLSAGLRSTVEWWRGRLTGDR